MALEATVKQALLLSADSGLAVLGRLPLCAFKHREKEEEKNMLFMILLNKCSCCKLLATLSHLPLATVSSSMAASCPWLPPLSLSCSWTADYCCLQRKREVVEVASWIVGCWLQITCCVRTNLRAKQAVPGSPSSALQHDQAPNLHWSINAFTSLGSWAEDCCLWSHNQRNNSFAFMHLPAMKKCFTHYIYKELIRILSAHGYI